MGRRAHTHKGAPKPKGRRFARWREHRRAKRQQAFEREYFERERSTGLPGSTPSTYQHHAQTGGWFGFGGDGGGCGGGDDDDGGGGGGC